MSSRPSSRKSSRGKQLFAKAAAQGRRHGQPVAASVRRRALEMIVSGVPPHEVAKAIGVTGESIRLWRRRAERDGTMPVVPSGKGNGADPAPSVVPLTNPVHAPTQPHDPGAGLGEHEVAAILELKKLHPSMGPAQIRTQLKRFKGWRVSVRAIARVLKRAGYELVHVASRPKGKEEIHRFEAPHRNALWQMDFADLRVGPERLPLLIVQDDFSRFVVAHAVLREPTSEAVVEVLRAAIRRHGKPEGVYTDRGGPFLAWRSSDSLERFLEAELIDHHVGTAYHPAGRGKIENLVGTVRRELWEIEHFESVETAKVALAKFFDDFNHRRAHMGIDGLVPADRFQGRWEAVLARVQAASRRRQGALLAKDGTDDPFVTEEIAGEAGPIEVLRLVVAGGRMEIRFLGHRVDLGAVKP